MQLDFPIERFRSTHVRGRFARRLATAIAIGGLMLAMSTSIVRAEVIYVKHDAAGLDNGASWADAYRQLTSALARATAGDQVWVAAGTYRPDETQLNPSGSGDTSKRFAVPDGIRLLAGFSGTEELAHQRDPWEKPTVLSGDLEENDEPGIANRTDNSNILLWADEITTATIIDGFVITGASSSAVFFFSGNANIVRCRFVNNSGRLIYGRNRGLLAGCLLANNRGGIMIEFTKSA